jgi:hypothetical protein
MQATGHGHSDNRKAAKFAKDRKAFMIDFNSLSSASLCELGGFAVNL